MRRSQSAATIPAVLMDTFQSILAKRLSEGLAKAGLPEAGELTQATDPRFDEVDVVDARVDDVWLTVTQEKPGYYYYQVQAIGRSSASAWSRPLRVYIE